MDRDQRIVTIAQTQIQIALAILPLGAGASGFLAQQKSAIAVTLSLVLIWVGLIIIALSVFLNLLVVKTTEIRTPAQRKSFEFRFQAAILAFVLGTIFLVVSPVGFALDQFGTVPAIDLETSSKSILFSLPRNYPIETRIVIIAHEIDIEEFPMLNLESLVSDPACLNTAKTSEQIPAHQGDDWITTWTITASTSCALGDYVVIFRIWSGTVAKGQTQLIVKIDP